MVTKYTPFRMCISCKERIEQNKLVRLQCKNREIVPYSYEGRSFYLCKDCLKNAKEDKLAKSLQRYCKTGKDKILKMVETHKEKIFNG